ncbi:conserved hypothetical protein [Vibrio coralliirubri]|nr:conserved hypothetical protein [Vibrio coralliirubri]
MPYSTYRDLIAYHLWRHAIHLTNKTENPFGYMGKLLATVHLNQPCNLEIVLVLVDHAFVSS